MEHAHLFGGAAREALSKQNTNIDHAACMQRPRARTGRDTLQQAHRDRPPCRQSGVGSADARSVLDRRRRRGARTQKESVIRRCAWALNSRNGTEGSLASHVMPGSHLDLLLRLRLRLRLRRELLRPAADHVPAARRAPALQFAH